MQRTTGQADHYQISLTPSKRQKYDNYTPRKRYVKDQEEFVQYRNFTFNEPQNTSPLKYSEDQQNLGRSRHLSNSTRREAPITIEETTTYRPPRSRQLPAYDLDTYNIPSVLDDCTSMVSNRPNYRQQRLKKNTEEVQMYKRYSFDEASKKQNVQEIHKRMNFEHFEEAPKRQRKEEFVKKMNDDENVDISNKNRPRAGKFIELEEEPLTPRKMIKNKENLEKPITEKMNALQAKIARLEKMTPKRSATPNKNARQEYSVQPYQISPAVVLFEKEEPKPEPISMSQVTAISERESQILSHVSLGRLVEQEEAESEIEVIQDLSYKISSKLQSIIRNFG